MTNVSIAGPDITLQLDIEGIILSASISNAISEEPDLAWQGRNWADTVQDLGGDKVRKMLADASAHGVSSFRQVNQQFPSGLELPIEYTTVRLTGQSGFVAVGKNLQAMADLQSRLIAAQQAMERDYWKLRDVETRYRHLFDASSEAVLVITPSDMRVAEANPAAIRALGLTPVGTEIIPELSEHERQSFQDMLALVRENGKAPGMLVHLGQERRPWMVRASLMAFDAGPVYLLQLTSTTAPVEDNPDPQSSLVESIIQRSPDAFAVLDKTGTILQANRAFLDMAQLGVEGAARGQSLGRWLARPGADANILLDSVRRHGSVRSFTTTFNGELGTDAQVEISAVGDRDENAEFFGVSLHDINHRPMNNLTAGNLDKVLEPFSAQIGSTPLKTLVKTTVGTVERHYVESALELTDGNRTAAAEILGLSRQSLYAKLNRYGLNGSGQSEPKPNDE